jgi:hypothetical protein
LQNEYLLLQFLQSLNAARTAAADFDAVDRAAALVDSSAETVALKRTASGTTEIVPTPVTGDEAVIYGASAICWDR